ncbi:NAD(P)/FAD-dependent oxidoreductase [Rudaeicoccus suwonensis]|uniref:NADPH-dependent 2,4-dienoyl-CoA reductase/sulfur reductase-like enzyme n=1 Tax=Rudaeicoccus suwonensis TaxID=657409 RepID=A0A561E152_9MICO|nr:FAD-dependent oxidoreductase [Rudaeicoccus suwonensis]TWE09310.1 NADPH-dependent 2,4-dienoyl-CoA reductase/sulfur reductase-like enzyme [Rudaeicoccus suwonensis]
MNDQSTDLSYDYVIVGAGIAAAAAVKGIRALDETGTVAIFGAESDAPVYRPDLSKTLWLEADKELGDSRLLDDETSVTERYGAAVASVAPTEHQLSLADGTTVGFGKLLLATGSRPRVGGIQPGDRVVYYRTAADYRRLRELAKPGAHIAVVGGGYIGSEIAAALSQNDIRVTLVVPDELVLQHMLPESLARHATEALQAHGVTIVHGSLDSGSASDADVTLQLTDGTEITADAAVVGIGATPETALAEAAGIGVDNGIVVDETLRTGAADVYAAGDVASYPDALLGRRRVEHADAAESMGEAAGRSMAGAVDAYTHTPFFWSDLYDDGYEAIGETSTALVTFEDWNDDRTAVVVYYLTDAGKVRGALLWNTWDSVPKAQAVIAETASTPVSDPSELKGRIPPG